jgi:light-regulated signal transduction histidine kinase (bacteriophytochrome)
MVGYWDRNLRNRFANHAYKDWFGADPAALRGTHLRDLMPADVYNQAVPHIERVFRGETQVFDRIIPYPDGSRYRYATTHYIPDIQGEEVRGFYVLAYDVSEAKGVESALRAANQELEAFSYAVAHDLRAPLRAMGGFSQALIQDFSADLQPEAHRYLQQIIAASRKMADLIDGLLSLSRSTQAQLRFESVDLSEIANSVRLQLCEANPERIVDWEIEPNLVGYGDSRMLDTVVRNLLDNAWKYTGKTPSAKIRFYAQVQEGIRWYKVDDNGAGFNPSHADQLFRPFQRLHRQDEFAGLGIGLATVFRIVQRHGGEIMGTSSIGNGATFAFTLGANNAAGKASLGSRERHPEPH